MNLQDGKTNHVSFPPVKGENLVKLDFNGINSYNYMYKTVFTTKAQETNNGRPTTI